ncbi:hypothetical protein GWI33_018657 [Rhynchophorus ferrugineus]|uniref:Uncharacterized protein n=1 Tax=Rhynchophorus ferrugineus TaxID=354439 RepID=A0A834HZT8_RHYFE|nr:hypothetical protein GWI33_018657 [Rhynchophorus ferrugineus]
MAALKARICLHPVNQGGCTGGGKHRLTPATRSSANWTGWISRNTECQAEFAVVRLYHIRIFTWPQTLENKNTQPITVKQTLLFRPVARTHRFQSIEVVCGAEDPLRNLNKLQMGPFDSPSR